MIIIGQHWQDWGNDSSSCKVRQALQDTPGRLLLASTWHSGGNRVICLKYIYSGQIGILTRRCNGKPLARLNFQISSMWFQLCDLQTICTASMLAPSKFKARAVHMVPQSPKPDRKT